MKKLILTIIITVVIISLISTTTASSFTNVSVGEAKAMIDSNTSLVLLDVRTLSEYNSGHIRNTMHLPLAELGGRLDELNPTDEILVYCASGGRSASASQLLVDNGFSHIYNMLGGITAWINAGYPVYIKYSSIQNAVYTATEGDTIYVSVGTYNENVVVNKSISLAGENKVGTIIDGNYAGIVLNVTRSNVTISGLTIQHSDTHINGGIKLSSVSNCSIFSNLIRDAKANGVGIILENSNDNRIYANILMNNTFTDGSICLYGSQHNIISDNYVTDYEIGIVIAYNSTNNYISNNIVQNGTASGIRIFDSDFNTLINNTLKQNQYRGLGLLAGTSNTTVIHNNFLNNTDQVSFSGSYNTTWDNGCEGNFWSNYNGTDLDDDGVGDTVLPWEGVDNYPLMNLYWNPGDIDHDFDVDIFDIVKAAGIYSSTPFDPYWNPHCDIAEPYGIIDIFDLVTIASSYGEEYTPESI